MKRGIDGTVLRQVRALFGTGAIRELTDGQLLERFASERGEAAELAFAVLVERHGPMVFRVCRAVLADPNDSHDAFQATFLVLVRKARGLWVRDSLGPWLHQVAYRTAAYSRSSAARRRRLDRLAAIPVETGESPSEDNLVMALHEEIERLPDSLRMALVLCDLEEQTHERAARHLGWPVGTVKSRLSRGRRQLRERLIRRGLAPEGSVLALPMPSTTSSVTPPAEWILSTSASAVRFAARATPTQDTASMLAARIVRNVAMTHAWKAASVVLTVVATVVAFGLAGDGPAPKAKPAIAPAAEVLTYEVAPGKLPVRVIVPGEVTVPSENSTLCRIPGKTAIVSILPDGSLVKEGQVVCELDTSVLAERLREQVARRKAADADHRAATAARERVEKQSASFEAAGANADEARQALASDLKQRRAEEQEKQLVAEREQRAETSLRTQIASATLRAPLAGLVVHANDRTLPGRRPLNIAKGATVRERQILFWIFPIGGVVQINAKIPEARHELVKPGQRARVIVEAISERVALEGKVTLMMDLPDPRTRFQSEPDTYTARIQVDRAPLSVRPWMAARVEIDAGELKNVLSVPVSAVVHRDGRDRVSVLGAGGATVWREVTLGVSNEMLIEVTKGLRPGDRVIVRPDAGAN
jgi:RNA polymerase sigma factor (sigma-70 family)